MQHSGFPAAFSRILRALFEEVTSLQPKKIVVGVIHKTDKIIILQNLDPAVDFKNIS